MSDIAGSLARIEQTLATLTGLRSIHELCQQSARQLACGHCGQKPGRACTDAGGMDGYHLARFAEARRRDLITGAEAGQVLALAEVITAGTIVRDFGNGGQHD